ncbi:MAG: serine/threonine-protein phosphatase [Planctomycetaceae bacterium]|nr:serine/threonine-protein phosphatase [Planctomycetaceae bacterium]
MSPIDEDATAELRREEFHVSRFFLPPPPPAQVEFGATSHPGKVRPNNEDHFLVLRRRRSLGVILTNLPEEQPAPVADQDAYIMAVADGMGGAARGEVASSQVLRTGVDLMLHAINWTMMYSEREIREAAEKVRMFYRILNHILLERARVEAGLAGMGTTLTATFTAGLDAFVLHAGDSRAYLFRAGTLEQLTHDHTLAQSLVESGRIAPGSSEARRTSHILTNYLGGRGGGGDADVHHLHLADGDRLLLCTDGLTDMVDDEEIARTLDRHPDAEGACRVLVERALERGGRDNVTAVLGRYHFPPTPERSSDLAQSLARFKDDPE